MFYGKLWILDIWSRNNSSKIEQLFWKQMINFSRKTAELVFVFCCGQNKQIIFYSPAKLCRWKMNWFIEKIKNTTQWKSFDGDILLISTNCWKFGWKNMEINVQKGFLKALQYFCGCSFCFISSVTGRWTLFADILTLVFYLTRFRTGTYSTCVFVIELCKADYPRGGALSGAGDTFWVAEILLKPFTACLLSNTQQSIHFPWICNHFHWGFIAWTSPKPDSSAGWPRILAQNEKSERNDSEAKRQIRMIYCASSITKWNAYGFNVT